MPGITANENDDEQIEAASVGDGSEADRDGDPGGDESDETDSADGIQLDMISAERMEGMRTMEKIRLILDGVHDGNIVILEQGLKPEEESKLIEVTMSEITPDGFTGIEIETYPGDGNGENGLLGRLMGRDKPNKLTVIGPANQIETLHKDETLISTLVTRT
jgi:hypothetical protein